MEPLLVWALLGVAVVVLLVRGSRAPRPSRSPPSLVAGSGGGHALWAARARTTTAAPPPRPPGCRWRAPTAATSSSDACRACHPSEYASWHRSYHRTMTQPATRAPTCARRSPARRSLPPTTARSYQPAPRRRRAVGRHLRRRRAPRRHDDRLAPHAGVLARRRRAATQLVEFPFTYLFDDRRWVPRRDVFLVGREYAKDAVDVEPHLHRVPRHRRAAAASTPQRRARRAASPSSASPARRATARRRRTSPPTAARSAAGRCTTAAPPTRPSSTRRACRRARAPRSAASATASPARPTAGCSTASASAPATRSPTASRSCALASLGASACRAQIAADASFAPSRYWKDGMVRVSGREYNGLVESPCFSARRAQPACRAIRCTTAIPIGSSRAARTATPPARSATPPSARTSPRTRTTRAGSTGSTCYNCHMPQTTYGLLRAMRSHQITIPRVQDDVDAGRPNACNLCHLDRTLAWTAARSRAGTARRRRRSTPTSSAPSPRRCSTSRAARRACARSPLEHGLERGARGVRRRLDGAVPHRAPRRRLRGSPLHRHIRSLRTHPRLRRFRVRLRRQPEASRWAAQREARAAAGRTAASGIDGSRAALRRDGRFQRGEFERLVGRARRRRSDVPGRMSGRDATRFAALQLRHLRVGAGRRSSASPRSAWCSSRCTRSRSPWYLGVATETPPPPLDAGARARHRARPGQPRRWRRRCPSCRGRLPARGVGGARRRHLAGARRLLPRRPLRPRRRPRARRAARSAGRAARARRARAHRARLLRTAPAMTSAAPTPRSTAPLTTSGVAWCASSKLA